jgi:UDP-N-acetylmuramoylalanine--D-glutamate ligase
LTIDSTEAVHSVELSSFQLETASTLRTDVAVLTNLSPDHLDRYESFDDYGSAKARLFELQQPDAFSVLNADDEASQRFHAAVRGQLHLFSTRGPVERGAFLEGGRLTLRVGSEDESFLDSGEIPLPGEHNIANALAAALAAKLAGCSSEAIIRGLTRFRALPHRLEHVLTLNEVAFYNDSKATNPASTARALAAFKPGTVHLILGGRDKGNDWNELAPLVRRQVRQLLVIGECAPEIKQELGECAPAISCDTVCNAVARGFADARPGDVVLMAPACASFDQYVNFEARGDDFRKQVHALKQGLDA